MIWNFVLATAFSFLGSVPPGSINVSMLQIGFQGKIGLSWRFAIAAAAVEYPYAWLAVTLESYIVSTPVIVKDFQLIAAIVMLSLGLINLWSVNRPSKIARSLENSGFRRGIILGILNPMAMPFWIGITAYLESMNWIDLDTPLRLHAYLFGAPIGALILLMLIAYAARRIGRFFGERSPLRILPGLALLALGAYSLIRYLI